MTGKEGQGSQTHTTLKRS